MLIVTMCSVFFFLYGDGYHRDLQVRPISFPTNVAYYLNTLVGRWFLKTALEGLFLVGAGIAIVGVAIMIVHEYRAAAVGPSAVLIGTALTLGGVLSASIANVMQGTRFARAQSMTVKIGRAHV